MKDRLTVMTKYLLDFMFWAGIVVIVTLPITFHLYGKVNSYFAEYYIPLCIIFAISGLFAVLIIKELRRMFASVLADDCFVESNVRSLKRMGTYSFMIAGITVGRLIFYLTPAVFIIILVFVIAGLFSKVLAKVFDKAVTYKQENDFTI